MSRPPRRPALARRPRCAPSGHSLVELLVTLVLLGIGAALLVGTDLAASALERRRRALHGAAALTRVGVAEAMTLRCGIDTAGAAAHDGVVRRWRAVGDADGTWLHDTIHDGARSSARTLRLPCRP